MSREKQIEEIYEVLTRDCDTSCIECKFDRLDLCVPHHKAEALYNAGYRKQSDGEWVSRHHMSRSSRGRYTSYNTYICGVCGKANGRRKSPFCPNCGAKMKGGAE